MKKASPLIFYAMFFFMPCIQAQPSVEVGFSPEGNAQALILNTLGEAKHSIRMMAYSFTSPDIVKALKNASGRGVDVKIVVDARGNQGKASRAAMNILVNAKIPVRTLNMYKILHDKVIIVDEKTVETGSFNFSRAAARSNSENIVVLRDMPDIAKKYLVHWQSRWEKGIAWKSQY